MNDFLQSQLMVGQGHELGFPDCSLVLLLCDASNRFHHKLSFCLLRGHKIIKVPFQSYKSFDATF